MSKSIKLGSDTYLDSSGVTVNSSGKTLTSWMQGVDLLTGNLGTQLTMTFTLANATRALFFSTGPNVTHNCMWTVSTTAAGIVYVASAMTGSQIQYDTSVANKLTITGGSQTMRFLFVILAGSVTRDA